MVDRQAACASKISSNCNSSRNPVIMSQLQKDAYGLTACSSCNSSTDAKHVPPMHSDEAANGAIGGRSPLASLTNRLPSTSQNPEATAAHLRGFPRGSARCSGDGGPPRRRVASRESLEAGDGSPVLTKKTTSQCVIAKDRKRHTRGKENAGLERRHVTTAAPPFSDTPTRWLDDRTAVAVATVAGAAGCDERSSPAQERPQQFHCTCVRHSATSPAHVPEESAAMIGDYTAPCCLPLSNNSRGEMQYISPTTAADLLRRQFDGVIENFHIVDCRYSYEYAAGHIQGAENVSTEDQLTLRFMKEPLSHSTQCRTCQAGDKRRNVIVFHCEFSSHRAPNMWKLLRRLDREQNMCNYPGLYYPEMYVIEGGYKAFFNQFPELCDPRSYKPMRGPEYRGRKELDRAARKKSMPQRMSMRLAMQNDCPPPMLQYHDDDDDDNL